MKGYYFSGIGGEIFHGDNECAALKLNPGKYLIFAKAFIAIGSYLPEAAYEAKLEVDGVKKDSVLGGLKYDFNDPGSRMEALALYAAADLDRTFSAVLRVFSTQHNGVFVWDPRLSVIELDDLEITNVGNQEDDAEQQALKSRLLTSSANAGFSLEAVIKALGQK